MKLQSQVLFFQSASKQAVSFTATFAACVILAVPSKTYALTARSGSNNTRMSTCTSDPAVVLRAVVTLFPSNSNDVTPDPLVSARLRAAEIQDKSVATQAVETIAALATALAGFDKAGLPILDLTESSDGSVTLEWRLLDRRLAFTLEPDRKESGWHLVFSRSSGGALAVGSSLPASDLPKVLAWTFGRFPKSA